MYKKLKNDNYGTKHFSKVRSKKRVIREHVFVVYYTYSI